MCLSIYFSVCNKASFVAIVVFSIEFWSMRSRIFSWNCWINISFFTALLLCSFYILDLNYFRFVKVLLCFCSGIISVIPGLGWLFIELPTSSSSPATPVKESFDSFLEISKSRSNYSFVRLVVNNIILWLDASYIKRLRVCW